MEGERLASGNPHADNVAPALLGGFTLVKSYEPLEVLRLPSLSELRVVVLHPLIELKTKDSRAVIRQNVPLKSAISQWGNLGALVSALYIEDYELLGRSLVDEIVEPVRSILIPFFHELKQIALENGALGLGSQDLDLRSIRCARARNQLKRSKQRFNCSTNKRKSILIFISRR